MSAVTRSVIVRLRAEMAQFKKEWNEGTGAVKGTRDELERTAKQSKQTARAVDESGTSVGKLSATLKNHRSEWDQVGSSLLKTGVALTAVSALVAKAAIDWETAWAGVLKTVDGTPAELAEVENGVRGLAKSMPEAHDQIAAVAEAAGQLGVRRQDLVEFTKNMVMLGDTTNLTADEAATSIAQLMNVMQTAPGDVDRLSATLVELGNSGASTERDIIQMAQRIAGAGEIVGLSEANVLALANALASSGIEVEAGGSAISSVLIDISKAVDTNSDKLGTWAKTAGMSADGFAAKWKADPASALADFTEGLGRMADNGENVFGVLDELGQSDIRVTRALLNMANAGDMLRESLANGDAAWEANTALVDEAEKRYDTTAAKAQIAWNNIKDAAIDAGQGMLPILSTIADVVVQVADAFGSLPDPVKAGLGILAGGTGVTLLAAGAFMKTVSSVADLTSSLATLNKNSPKTAATMTAIGKNGLYMAAGLTAIAIAGNQISDSSAADVNEYAEAILKLGSNSKGAAGELQDLVNIRFGKDSMENLVIDLDANGFRKALSGGLDLIGLGTLGAAEDSVKAWDDALTSLVQDGRLDEAQEGFNVFADAAQEQGKSLAWAKDQFPGYATALKSVKREQAEAAEAFDEAAAGSQAMEMRLAQLAPTAEEAQKALQQMRERTQENAASFFDFTTNLEDAKLSFDGWLKQLDEARKAQDNWADNLIKATARGVDEGVINQLEEAGPQGAQLLADLADASDEEIDRVNENFRSIGNTAAQVLDEIPAEIITQFRAAGADGAIETAARVATQYGLTPDQVQTILEALDYSSADIRKVMDRLAELDKTKATPSIDVATGDSVSKINQLQRLINGMNGKTVRVAVEGGSPGGITRAEGGPITGVGGPKQDNILVNASVGEHMWTALEVANAGGHGAVYAMRAAARAGRRPNFADGGAIDHAWNQSFRSAAAAYGAPVSSVAASAPIVLAGDNAPLSMDDSTIARLERAQERGAARGIKEALGSIPAGQTLREILAGG